MGYLQSDRSAFRWREAHVYKVLIRVDIFILLNYEVRSACTNVLSQAANTIEPAAVGMVRRRLRQLLIT